MATIALYSGKINHMPGLIKEVKKSVIDYKSELASLKKKALSVNKSICDLDDVISKIKSSTKMQEDKINSLEKLNRNIEEFVEKTISIDNEVANVVKNNKDDFYNKYSYLKPESEKSGLEKAWESCKSGLKSIGAWCKEHWKLLVTIALVIASVVVIVCTWGAATGPVVAILVAACKGLLIGAAVGGSVGGVMSAISGGSFFEGFENGAFSGAIAGMISGGMGFAMSSGGTLALGLGKTMMIGGVSGVGTSFVSDLGDILIKGTDTSFGQVLLNMGISGTLGAAFAGIGYGLAKGFSALKVKFFNKGTTAKTITAGESGLNSDLLDELANSGVKYNSEDIVAITKTADGKLVWLENGTDTVGLNHIITEHADDFLNKGITQEQIPDYVMNALENGKIVGYQGRGTGRPIYEFTYNGEIHKVAITVGNNGFIVGANPK